MKKPLFKKGDKVRCIERIHGNETVGKVYIITRDVFDGDEWLHITKDDNGVENMYYLYQFVLAECPCNALSLGVDVEHAKWCPQYVPKADWVKEDALPF